MLLHTEYAEYFTATRCYAFKRLDVNNACATLVYKRFWIFVKRISSNFQSSSFCCSDFYDMCKVSSWIILLV